MKDKGRTFWDWASENRKLSLFIVLISFVFIGYGLYSNKYNIKLPLGISFERETPSPPNPEKEREKPIVLPGEVRDKGPEPTGKIIPGKLISVLIVLNGDNTELKIDDELIQKTTFFHENLSLGEHKFEIIGNNQNCIQHHTIKENTKVLNLKCK